MDGKETLITIGVVMAGTLTWELMRYRHREKVNKQKISIMTLQKELTMLAMNQINIAPKEEA